MELKKIIQNDMTRLSGAFGLSPEVTALHYSTEWLASLPGKLQENKSILTKRLELETFPMSETNLLKLLLDKEAVKNARLYYHNLFQYQMSLGEFERINQQIVTKRATTNSYNKVENQIIEHDLATPLATHEISEKELQQLQILSTLAKFSSTPTEKAKQYISSMMQNPTSQEDAIFLLFLFDAQLMGQQTLPETAEKQYHYVPVVGDTLRKSAGLLYENSAAYMDDYIANLFHPQVVQRTPLEFPSDSLINIAVMAEMMITIPNILPTNFAKILRAGLIPHNSSELTKEAILLYQEQFMKLHQKKLEGIKCDNIKPYQLVLTSYENGTDSPFYDAIERSHANDDPVDLEAMVFNILKSPKDPMQYDTLNAKILKKGAMNIFVEDDEIANIFLTALDNNFIDVIVVSHDNEAFAIQFDRNANILGIPQPYSEQSAKLVGHIFGHVTSYLENEKIIRVPQQSTYTSPKTAVIADRRVTSQQFSTVPTRDERMRAYTDSKTNEVDDEGDILSPQEAKDDKEKFLRALGIDPNAPQESKNRAYNKLRLIFPSEEVQKIRKGRRPEDEFLVRKAKKQVRKELLASENGLTPSIKRVKSMPGVWRVKVNGNDTTYRVFFKEDNKGDLIFFNIEKRDDHTYERR